MPSALKSGFRCVRYEIGRPSLLLLRAKQRKNERIDVNVGGKAIMVAKGELM